MSTLVTLALAIVFSVWQWGERKDLIADALRLDELTLILTIIFCVAAACWTCTAGRIERVTDASPLRSATWG